MGTLLGAGGHYSNAVSGPEGTSSAFYDLGRSFPNGTYTPVVDERHSTVVFQDEATAVIAEHARDRQQQPLFLYVAMQAAHTPAQADAHWMRRCAHLPHRFRQAFCGMVVGADDALRNITDTARQQLGDNIVVIVTTDNGGMLHVGGLNTPLRGGKNTGYEGCCRAVGVVADLSPGKAHLGKPRVFDGLIHIADWMPSLLGIADRASGVAATSGSDGGLATIGEGFDMGPALRSGGPSPRLDAVLVLDAVTNFVSYVRLPWKVMVGHFGTGEWATEPQGRYLLGEEADWLDKYSVGVLPRWLLLLLCAAHSHVLVCVCVSCRTRLEEHIADGLDWACDTRDVSFFWKEVVHVVAGQLRGLGRRLSGGHDPDLYNADKPMLGSGEHVLEGTQIPSNHVPLQLFNILDDPEERCRDTVTTATHTQPPCAPVANCGALLWRHTHTHTHPTGTTLPAPTRRPCGTCCHTLTHTGRHACGPSLINGGPASTRRDTGCSQGPRRSATVAHAQRSIARSLRSAPWTRLSSRVVTRCPTLPTTTLSFVAQATNASPLLRSCFVRQWCA